MRKIGIITIQSIVNYGNRFQNYAVQSILEGRGYVCESIIIDDDLLWFKIKIKAFLGCILPGKIHKESIKTRKFLNFNKKYINIKKISKQNIKSYIHNNYDYLFLGGDQLWAPGNKDYGIAGYRFGTLIESKKRIPFGVSFGTDNLPEYYKKEITTWLLQLNHLAIREKSGAKLIKEMTGKDAEVLLDPVFYLSKGEWDKIAIVSNQKKDYAFSFFLGGCNKDNEIIINEMIGNLTLKKTYCKDDDTFLAGPEEFLGLIKNAKIILTDSFHGVAFAIIYKKPFVVFKRENWDRGQMTRLNNILSCFEMQDRVYSGKRKNWFEIDYSKIDSILQNEKNKIDKYLDICLSGRDNFDPNN